MKERDIKDDKYIKIERANHKDKHSHFERYFYIRMNIISYYRS